MNGFLWIARHAAPLDAEGLCYGTLDLPADACATATAAAALAARLPAGARLQVSPARRCRQLADAVQALRPELPAAIIDARLAEMHFGAWEGRRWDALCRTEIDAWAADFENYRAGGSGESARQVLQRVAAARDDARRAAERSDEVPVWITHNGVVKALDWLQASAGAHAPPLTAAGWPARGLAWGSWKRVALAA